MSLLPTLSPIESRILGTLVEKQRTVPDTYPLSLNALVAGCNQKTSRSPVMEVSEAEALAAVDRLKEHQLVHEVSGSRVVRFAHNLEKQLGIPTQASALLTVLLLRGPQTAGELRLNCERLHKFADISSVEAFLDELACRPEGEMLVIELPRLPGARENRWMHLLGGELLIDAPAHAVPVGASGAAIEALTERVATLEAELAALRSRFEAFVAEIGG
ncbi:DUF480 domain-containing protein [Dechloromonas sp. TW-R-39-2]|nr:DUF480 domain-containing protein [Dechloromonas sp. TW-R-39-2]